MRNRMPGSTKARRDVNGGGASDTKQYASESDIGDRLSPEMGTRRKANRREMVKGIGRTKGTRHDDEKAATSATTFTISRYVWQPLLVCGRKFDLRLYVCVVSYNPPVAYLHEEGLARLAPRLYDMSPGGLRDRLRHLTNASISRKALGAELASAVDGSVPARM